MPDYNSTGSARPAKRPAPGGSALPVPRTGGGPMPVPDNKHQAGARKLMMDSAQMAQLQNNLHIAGLFINSRHLEMLSPDSAVSHHTSATRKLDPVQMGRRGIAVFQLTKLMYNAAEDSFEKLVSVYSALNSFGGIAAMILQSDGRTTSLYLCTNTSGTSKIAPELLASNMRGQFPGCEILELSEPRKNALLDSFGMRTGAAGKTIRSVSMIPSRREDERKNNREFSAQGYEKFVDAMNGQKYTLVVISQRVSPDAMEECRGGLENLYTCLSPYAKESVTYGENESDSINYSVASNINSSLSSSISRSFGTSHTSSISRGQSTSRGRGYEFFDVHFNSGTSSSFGTGSSTGSSQGTSSTRSESDSYGTTDSQSSGSTSGVNRSLTMNRDNKAVQNLLMKVEEHIKRINGSQTFGMWNSACYLIADNVATATMGTSTLASLFSGDSMAVPRAYYNQWDATNPTERDHVLEYLQNLQHPVIELTMQQEIVGADGKKTWTPTQTQQVTPAMMISGREIPTMMGLPRKSVPGIVVDTMAEFGRNIPEKWKKSLSSPIDFGNICHMGQTENTQTVLDLDTFTSHVFICGASGSGKSNTTYNLLQELIDRKVPFLVIEPAKGDYKDEFADLPGVNIFTAVESSHRLLQINPFEFSPGIHIREHLDNIIQVVSACWPLHGAMPGLLKQAFEEAYIKHGWDLEHSERIANRGSKFPVFRDMVDVLTRIIDESSYSNQAKSDYKGALVNRISSLCNGFEGQIFGRSVGVPDRTLFGENTIIDLSSIGSDETRSLIMGMLIIKLRHYRKRVNSGPNSPLLHVTVLEEAHTILKRCSQDTNVESANVQGAAVASLCRSIAEMRSSGEGFMIIDQSPGSVDEAAIKNTAIKIVMRLPYKEDREEMGASLSLNENQIRELSRLDVGVAAIFHVGWTDTVLAKMGTIWDKRYRRKSPSVLDSGTYTKIQGAVVQLIWHDLANGDCRSIYSDVQELLDDLCKGPSAIRPVLPFSKQRELLDEVYIFLQDQDALIRGNEINRLKRAFFRFAFDFLRLSSVMRIYELKDVETKPLLGAAPKKKDTRKILSWERELRPAVARYLYMPEVCEPAHAYKWCADATRAEYFMDIYAGILATYAVMFRRDCRYENAMDYLHSIKHFGGRR